MREKIKDIKVLIKNEPFSYEEDVNYYFTKDKIKNIVEDYMKLNLKK